MKTRILSLLVIAAALAAAAPRPALALSPPAIDLTVGRSFGADGAPDTGGLSATVAPLWSAGDRARFGVAIFADDIGTNVQPLLDPNNGTNLGDVASLHRWTYGAAWRADVDVMKLGAATNTLSGTLGWWRIVDDRRGDIAAAASAVGVGLGAATHRPLAPGQSIGLALRWQRLFAERNSSYRRVQQYATVALEWGWAATTQRP